MARRKDLLIIRTVLIQLIKELLPNGEYGWQAVAIAYQDRTKEEALRDSRVRWGRMAIRSIGAWQLKRK
jgi:hypothetical protein